MHHIAPLLGVLALAGTLAAQEPLTADSRISAVTLYRGTALVTRDVELPPGASGTIELLVSPLPSATEASSVFADRAEGLGVRSVACRTRPPQDADQLKGQVAELDARIHELEQTLATARNEIALRRIRQEYLRALGRFVAPAAQQEMTHGVLQAAELEKMTQLHFSEYEKASQEIMKLDFEIEEGTATLEQLKAERAKLAQGPPQTYDAVIYLDKPVVGPGRLKLNYLVKDCGWTPVYNVRGDTGKAEVEIEFNALIHQVSGEDWRDARLSLSTASPTVSAFNPRLSPLYVGVNSAEAQQAVQQQEPARNAQIYTQAVAQKKSAVEGQMRGSSFDEMATANFDANASAASVQLIELSERLSELRLISQGVGDDDLSIEYPLADPVSLVSRREGQMVPVLRHSTAAAFYHVAAPVLTTAVFREAELANATPNDLLGGQVNVYLDGQFTGRTEIPTIARGRKFSLGFGIDGQLRARRTMVDRRDAVQGGNRQLTLTCEVVVDNYKDQPVTVRVRERTPFMEDAASLRVAVGETSHPLSDDPDYARFEKPKGILLWNLPVQPGTGKDATTLRYAYSLEFDKSLTLQEISAERKTRLRTEFLQESKAAIKK